MAVTESGEAVRVALRVAIAAGLTTVVAFWVGLALPQIAVGTAFMTLFSYSNTPFQKALERLGGRGLGIALGLLISFVGIERPLLAVPLELLALLMLYYVHFSGRWSYAFLQSGLYLSAVTLAGVTDPWAAWQMAGSLLAALFVGVFVAVPVNWLLGGDRRLGLVPGGHPLLPVNAEWVNHSMMLVATVAVTEALASAFDLPLSQAVTSVFLLMTTASREAMTTKGWHRVLGALTGGAWTVAGVLLLGRLPYFPILVMMQMIGMFIAVRWSLTSERPYAGVQMGLVIALALVAEPHVPGERQPVEARLEGIAVGLLAGLVVMGLWPRWRFK